MKCDEDDVNNEPELKIYITITTPTAAIKLIILAGVILFQQTQNVLCTGTLTYDFLMFTLVNSSISIGSTT